MDIIAAHQQGLIEQLEEEVAALAGRPRDQGQRAVVLHHLYDHSRGNHVWALAEARRELRIAAGLAALERKLGRWGWLSVRREEARAALGELSTALGEAGRQRTAAAYRAYRLSSATALRASADEMLPAELLSALDACHRCRREGEDLPAELRLAMAEEMERFASQAVDQAILASAWAAVDRTALKRSAHRLLGDKALARMKERDERRGLLRVELELRNDDRLPAAFRANPAQHFYALHRVLAERRRQQWREACDREAGAFELAA